MSDAELRQQVDRELAWDGEIPPKQVSVEVHDGTVILRGTVEHWAPRLAAQRAATRVSGVRTVLNRIVVHFPTTLTHADTDVAAQVRHQIEELSDRRRERIHSTVSAGWVRLTGDVTSGQRRRSIERAVKRTEGVRGVTDQLLVVRRHGLA